MSAQRRGTNGGCQNFHQFPKPESFPTGNSGDIPVLVQELAYGGKEQEMGTFGKSGDRHNKLLSSTEEFHGPRPNSRPSEVLDSHVFQRTSPKGKSLVEEPKYFVRGPGELVVPKEGQ
ncbi:hypothetical protein O181_000743 [Austropuccinia psidii MF-1]|uniref:Uncharacterized protein n=1 Tax=Austropuccinia psidii MF-1 TaxID=1389203 RepID=A0A9Q3B945_9BASI|nr:hypothetical protein [Austropuccinia psidii MF-1]